jgi:peptide/nickel transport system substrate-binding protein
MENFFARLRRTTNIRYYTRILSALTGRERKVFIVALFLFVVSLGAILGRAYFHATMLVPVQGGEYREGIVGQPISVNPILNQHNDVDRDIIELVFSGLFKTNGHGGVRPDLAESYTMSEDGKVWTIYLRNNVFWHDGEKLTADDVVFTVEAIQDVETGSRLFASWQGVIVERVSSLEVRFTLRTPYAPFIENLKDLKILPRHLYQAIPHANFRTSDYNLEPVGTGPFRFVAAQKQKDGFIQSYTLGRNEQYYGGPVFIDRINIRFYQDTEALIDAFNNREIDGFGNGSEAALAKIKIPVQTYSFSLPRYYAIFLNQNIAGIFADSAVRKALVYGIDSKSMVQLVFGGHGAATHEPLLPGMLGYESREPVYPYDPERAAKTLDDAGWRMPEDGGTRIKGDQALSFELVVPDTEELRQAAEMAARDLEKIGVRLSMITLPLNEITGEVMRGRTYQALLFGNIINFESDLFAFWHSSQRLYPGLNLALFSDKNVDARIESARQSLDRDARAIDVREAAHTIETQAPAVFLFSPDYLYVMNNKVRDIRSGELILTPAERFSKIETWSINQVRVFK